MTDYYQQYRAYLQRTTGLHPYVSCPQCRDRVQFRVFNQHCRQKHGIRTAKSCAFCRGAMTWPYGQIESAGQHLLACAQYFNAIYGLETPFPVAPSPFLQQQQPSVLPPNPDSCDQGCFLFSSDVFKQTYNKIPNWSERAKSEGGVHLMYESLFPSEAEWLELPDASRLFRESLNDPRVAACRNTLRFHPRSGLGDVHRWIFRYLYYEKTYDWFHLVVHAGCMKSFVEAMRDVELVALPYFTVCDSGLPFEKGTEALLPQKHHRHFLLAVKDTRAYKRALETRVVYHLGTPEPNFKRYYSKRIVDAYHFVASIAYVSRPRSKCACDKNLTSPRTMYQFGERYRYHRGHYYIELPMTPHALYWMLMLVPGDGLDRLARFRVSVWSVHNLRSRRRGAGGKWEVNAVRELKIQQCVVCFDPPLQRIVMSTDRVFSSDAYIYWFGNQTRWVVPMEECPTEEWLALNEWCTSRKINTMLNVDGVETWVELSKKGQQQANDLESVRREVEAEMTRACASKVREWERRQAALTSEWDRQRTQMEEDKRALEVRIQALENELRERQRNETFDAVTLELERTKLKLEKKTRLHEQAKRKVDMYRKREDRAAGKQMPGHGGGSSCKKE